MRAVDQLGIDLQLAGMNAAGLRRLSRPLQGLGWYPQEVWDDLFEDADGKSCLKMVRDLNLDLTPVPLGDPLGGDRRIESDEGVLDAFVKLADATDKQILSFAQKYGALEMCEHGIPPRWDVLWAGRTGPNSWQKEWCLDSNIVLHQLAYLAQWRGLCRFCQWPGSRI